MLLVFLEVMQSGRGLEIVKKPINGYGNVTMANIAIIFGTDTGYTRKTAKMMAKSLGKVIVPNKPININRVSIDDFLTNDTFILGTPTYGEGVLPGIATGIEAGSWAEFLPQLSNDSLKGKMIALYGLGDQKNTVIVMLMG